MDVTIQPDTLKQALSFVGLAVNKKATNTPIINNILFRFLDNNRLKLTATDNECELSVYIEYEGDGKDFTVSGKKLIALISNVDMNKKLRGFNSEVQRMNFPFL